MATKKDRARGGKEIGRMVGLASVDREIVPKLLRDPFP
jgi:hypothetical protein